MLFDWTFLIALILVVPLHFFAATRFRPIITLITSLAIISYWSYLSILLLLLTSCFTWVLNQYGHRNSQILGVFVLAASTLLFKTKLPWAGNSAAEPFLILGYSYFTLQNISVLLERQKIRWQQLALANVFFPKFIAGPIVTPSKFVSEQNISGADLIVGTKRILYGLVKKFVLADRLGLFVNNLFEAPQEQSSIFSLGVASACFTLQMYLDFSAYSDLAIGAGRLFGYKIPENFNLPLRSKSVAEYWRKTHITLISWLSKYIYYPIQYQFRKSILKGTLVAILITFTLSGFWHGFTVGFIIWGLLNASYLMIEFISKKKLNICSGWWSWPITIMVIILSNYFFKLKDWDTIYKVSTGVNQILPTNWTLDFWAVLADGGHLLQQYNITESTLLTILFFLGEKHWETKVKSTNASFTFFILIGFLLIFFGYFHLGEEFIYVQF